MALSSPLSSHLKIIHSNVSPCQESLVSPHFFPDHVVGLPYINQSAVYVTDQQCLQQAVYSSRRPSSNKIHIYKGDSPQNRIRDFMGIDRSHSNDLLSPYGEFLPIFSRPCQLSHVVNKL